MLRQLFFGGAISAANIAIHAVIMTVVVQVARRAHANSNVRSSAYLVLIMIPTVLVLMAAHTLEVIVWATAYFILGVVSEGGDRFYFAFVNYTTLGYGDIIPVERWRLLGPITAMNGVLLFGWSTAVIYDVLRNIARVIPVERGAGSDKQ